MLNNNQLIAVHLIASGVKASIIANQLDIREETLSRWRQIDEFKEALEVGTHQIELIVTDSCNNKKIIKGNFYIK